MPTNNIRTIGENCKEAITSENYLDFIVEYNGNILDLQSRLNPDCIQVISNKFANLFFRRQTINLYIIEKYGYKIIPHCYALLDTSSMEESGIIRLQREPYLHLHGTGVMIGFVDTGIDYLHPAFVNEDNTTRIYSIWDQTIEDGIPPENYAYGAEYRSEQINEALNSENPLDIVPSVDEIGHGTFLAGIAAGNQDIRNEFTGAAPESTITVVKLKQAKNYLRNFYFINEDVPCYQETDIMTGINYLISRAKEANMPLVVCIGLGTNSGDHEGLASLGEYINIEADNIGQVFVIAGGNEVNLGHHFAGQINKDLGYQDVEIRVDDNESGFTLELWGSAPDVFSVGLISPSGEYVEKIPPRLRQSDFITFILEDTKIAVNYRLIEAKTGDELIIMQFDSPTPGIWIIRVFGDFEISGQYDMWLPVNGFISSGTYFITPDPFVTLCSPSIASVPITVSTYNHSNGSLFINSSRGYTREGRIKPDIAAPGVNVYGPLAGGGYGTKTGSSIAAAHAAGGAALLMEWGVVRRNDPSLDSREVKKFFIRGASRSNIIYPNREWGYGKLDMYNTFQAIRITVS